MTGLLDTIYDFGAGLIGADNGGASTQAYQFGQNPLSGLMDYAQANQAGIKALGTGLTGLGNIYSAMQQADYAKGLLDLQKQQVAREQEREEEAETAMAIGFQQSGLSNYYGV